jgi:ectoine hydroxylase-related dioxygenase (phytanoyl-CoA dioxygenase family)
VRSAALDVHIQRIELDGFTVVPGLLTPEECDEARRELERLLAAERDLPGAPHGPHGAQVYMLMNKARVFERVYRIPALLALVRHFLGEDAVLSSVQAHIVFPGAPAQRLHSDGSLTGPNRPPAAADAGRRIVSHVLGFNVAFCISDFTSENGATRVVPGSHRVADIAVPQTAPNERTVEADRGSAVVFNICTWHGASAHRGQETRYAVMTPWRRRWLRPEADLPRAVAPEVVERAGDDGRILFGFAATPPYLDRWQWDADAGRPTPPWAHPDETSPHAGVRRSKRETER